MNKRQLARRLKKAERTIDYWRKHEGLPCLKIRHTVFFRWDEVVRHLEKTTGKSVNGKAVRKSPRTKGGPKTGDGGRKSDERSREGREAGEGGT